MSAGRKVPFSSRGQGVGRACESSDTRKSSRDTTWVLSGKKRVVARSSTASPRRFHGRGKREIACLAKKKNRTRRSGARRQGTHYSDQEDFTDLLRDRRRFLANHPAVPLQYRPTPDTIGRRRHILLKFSTDSFHQSKEIPVAHRDHP